MEPIVVNPGLSDSLTVEPVGARKLLTIAGQSVLTKITRGDGKVGSTHPCTPIFGPDRNKLYGLNQHGNTRNEPCQVTQTSDTTINISHPITDPGYPQGVVFQQTVALQNGVFSVATAHTNTGTQPAAVNTGEHCYFDAPQGYSGTTVNGFDISDMIKNNIAGVPIELQATNTISIPGKPAYTLVQEGFSHVMLWVGEDPETRFKDSNYVCIEPVEANPNTDFFGSPASLLQPGERRLVWFSLAIDTTTSLNSMPSISPAQAHF